MNYKNRSPIMVIVLTFITCGFYFFYWLYRVSEELLPYNDSESITPALEVLLCIVCFPYVYYWFYKYSKILYMAQSEIGMTYPEDNSIINVILSIFGLGFVSSAILQNGLNKLWNRYEDNRG